MKVLIIHNRYREYGGEQAAVDAQVELLRQYGHDVLVFARDNTEIDAYGAAQRARFLAQTVFSRPVYRELLALAARERPDIAHVHNVFPLITPAAYRALEAARVPIVQTIHNYRLLCPNALFYTRGSVCERCMYGQTQHAVRWRCYRDSYALSALYALSIGVHRRAGTFAAIDRFIALTPFVARKLVESGLAENERISVLGNYVADPPTLAGISDASHPYVLFLGRLASEKGARTLIEAAAHVRQVRVKIVGDGPDATHCRDQARSLRVDNVEFLGPVFGKDKWALVCGALAVVVPSVWFEHLPFVVLESMAAGTAVVASSLGSLATLIDDGSNGLLFEPGNAEDLADKLRALWQRPDMAAILGAGARRTFEDRWTARRHIDGLQEIYASVLRSRARSC